MPFVLRIKEKSRLSMQANIDHRATLTFKGKAVATQVKRRIPSETAQDIKPDEGYFLSNVIVEAIPSYYGRIAYNGGIITVY